MHTSLRWLTAIAIVVVFVPSIWAAKAEGLFYYVPDETAWASLRANIHKISIVAPQVFVVDEEGNVRGEVEKRVRDLASRHQVGVVPLLVNRDFDNQVAHSVLARQDIREKAITAACARCLENGCAGLQLDFENILEEDAALFTAFVQQLSTALRKRNLPLSIALPSPLSASGQPLSLYPSSFGGFPISPLSYDLRAIEPYVAFISLMTYDEYWGGTPGPVAGYAWVEQSIRYVLQTVSPRKLSAGLGLFSGRWCGQQASQMGYADAMALARNHSAVVRWHGWHRTPWFDFSENGCRNIVYLENARSLKEKLRLVGKYKLRGFSAWRLGHEDPAFWR